MKKTIYYSLAASCALLLVCSCAEWTEPEPVVFETQTPAQQNPELWARYLEVLRAYKQGSHFMVYGKFANGAEKPASGAQLLRALPDSLDIVSLTQPDRMTDADRAGIAALHEKGTRVLCCIDYAARAAELSDAAAEGLDGFSFTGIPSYGAEAEINARREAAKLIVRKLSAVAGAGKDKLLVFEGNPAFLDEADLPRLDYLVLDTEKTANATDLKIQVGLALDRGLSRKQLLLCGSPEGELVNEENVKQKALEALVDRVASLGPLAGLAVSDLGKAYYDPERRYSRVRNAIRLMNP